MQESTFKIPNLKSEKFSFRLAGPARSSGQLNGDRGDAQLRLFSFARGRIRMDPQPEDQVARALITALP